MTVIIMNLV